MARHNTFPIASVAFAAGTSRESVWEKITDFHGWPESMPRLHSVKLPNTEQLGRGSVIVQQWGAIEEEWQIDHWHPGQCLELILQQSLRSIGIRFEISSGQDPDQLQLRLEAECRCHGPFRIFQPLQLFLLNRKLKNRFSAFLRAIQ